MNEARGTAAGAAGTSPDPLLAERDLFLAERDPFLAERDPFLAERGWVLRRSLRALPSELLEAMIAGLEKHADELVTGRLFKSPRGGGCAVGVMLRELEPSRYEAGPVRFWLGHAWRRRASSYRGRLEANPRLKHLEWTYDDTARRLRQLRPGLSRTAAAAAVGRWFQLEAERELRWRDLSEAAAPAGGRALDRAAPAEVRA